MYENDGADGVENGEEVSATIERWQKTLDDQDAEIAKKQEENLRLTRAMEELENTNQKLKKEIVGINFDKVSLALLKKDKEQKIKDIQTLTGNLAREKTAKEAAERKTVQTQNDLDQMTEKKNGFEAAAAQSKKDLDDMTEKKNGFEAAAAQSKKDLEDMTNKKNAAVTKCTNLQTQMDEMTRKHEAAIKSRDDEIHHHREMWAKCTLSSINYHSSVAPRAPAHSVGAAILAAPPAVPPGIRIQPKINVRSKEAGTGKNQASTPSLRSRDSRPNNDGQSGEENKEVKDIGKGANKGEKPKTPPPLLGQAESRSESNGNGVDGESMDTRETVAAQETPSTSVPLANAVLPKSDLKMKLIRSSTGPDVVKSGSSQISTMTHRADNGGPTGEEVKEASETGRAAKEGEKLAATSKPIQVEGASEAAIHDIIKKGQKDHVDDESLVQDRAEHSAAGIDGSANGVVNDESMETGETLLQEPATASTRKRKGSEGGYDEEVNGDDMEESMDDVDQQDPATPGAPNGEHKPAAGKLVRKKKVKRDGSQPKRVTTTRIDQLDDISLIDQRIIGKCLTLGVSVTLSDFTNLEQLFQRVDEVKYPHKSYQAKYRERPYNVKINLKTAIEHLKTRIKADDSVMETVKQVVALRELNEPTESADPGQDSRDSAEDIAGTSGLAAPSPPDQEGPAPPSNESPKQERSRFAASLFNTTFLLGKNLEYFKFPGDMELKTLTEIEAELASALSKAGIETRADQLVNLKADEIEQFALTLESRGVEEASARHITGLLACGYGKKNVQSDVEQRQAANDSP